MRNKNIIFYLTFIIVFIVFWIKGIFFLDPDFGWRLVSGKIYATSGIPKIDTFSYTMPTFPWVDHAWSQSYIMSLLFTKIGNIGTAFVFMILPLATLIVVAKACERFYSDKKMFENVGFVVGGRFLINKFFTLSTDKIGFFASFPFWLGASILLTFSGIRAQLISWLMIALLYFLFFKNNLYQKYRFLLPAFFLLWANLHGSFLSGLITLGLYVFLKSVKEKRVLISDFALTTICALLTLVNPYGTGIWREVLSSVRDSSLRLTVNEWMPAVFMFDISMAFLIVISLTLLARFRKKYAIEEIGLYLAFLFQAILSRRHLPLWTIFAVPISVKGIYYLWLEASKTKLGILRFKNIYKWAWLLALIIFLIQTSQAYREALYLREDDFYPTKAINYLSINTPKGEIFSEYGWGGYLILKLPEKKVFVDGRMPSWKRNNVPDRELASAFDTYLGIIKGTTEYNDVFEKYDIEIVLWSKSKKERNIDKHVKRIENYIARFGWKKDDFSFIQTLEDNGWQKVYEDERAVIHKRPEMLK